MAEKLGKVTLSAAQKALQSVIAPDMNEIKTSIKVIDAKLDGTNTRIDEMDKRLTSEIRGLSEKVDLVRDVERLKIEVAELKRRK